MASTIITLLSSVFLSSCIIVSTIGAVSIEDITSHSQSGTPIDQTNQTNNPTDQVNSFAPLNIPISHVSSISTSLNSTQTFFYLLSCWNSFAIASVLSTLEQLVEALKDPSAANLTIPAAPIANAFLATLAPPTAIVPRSQPSVTPPRPFDHIALYLQDVVTYLTTTPPPLTATPIPLDQWSHQ